MVLPYIHLVEEKLIYVKVLKPYSEKKGPPTVALTLNYYICKGDRVGIDMYNAARYAANIGHLK